MKRVDRPEGKSGKPGQTKTTYTPYRTPYERYVARQNGLNSYVDAEPVQTRINELLARGMTQEGIARAAGVAPRTVHFIKAGKYSTCRRRVHDAIMGVLPKPVEVQRQVKAFGVIRRLQALQRAGYRFADMDEQLGLPAGVAGNLMHQQYVSVERWRQVVDGYEVMSAKPGPSAKSARIAAKKGWPSPWDWETANIDDPLSYPAEDSGPSRGMLKRQAAALDGPGVSAEALAERLGVSARTIVRWRTERRNSGKEVGGE